MPAAAMSSTWLLRKSYHPDPSLLHDSQLKMNRMRRFAGMGKTKVQSAVQKDKDDSIVFFRELYKHEKDTDVNLLEPMYSVEFDTIQGGHMPKLPPSGKRDFLIPVDEKHDYDWLKPPPAALLFPSLAIGASSSEMGYQNELPIQRPVKPSASRFSGKPEETKTSARPASPPADSASKKNSKEKNQSCAIDNRSTYTAITNRQQKAAAATAQATTAASKKHPDRCHASQGSSTASAAKRVTVIPEEEAPYVAPKNLLTTGSLFARRAPPPATATAKARSRDPAALGAHARAESGKARRPPCPPAAAARGVIKEMRVDGRQNGLPARGKAVAAGEPARDKGGRAGEAAPAKGARRADGKNERRPRFADK